MMEEEQPLGHRGIEPLILRALVRKLVAAGVLSREDVRAILFDAARGLDMEGSTLTPQAARDLVNEDFLRPFLGDAKPDPLD